MDLQLDNKVIVVTGGSGSLGRVVVEKFVEAGALCAIPLTDMSELKVFPFDDHENVHLIKGVDLSDEKQAEYFFEEVADQQGGPWASVHLAGGFGMGKLEDTSLQDFKHQMHINAYTCFNSCKAAVRRMRKEGKGGRIVNVSSRPGIEARHGKNLSAYTASKAAVAALTQSLAAELVEEEILVNAVAPSIIDTEPNREAMPHADYKKWVEPSDLASQILYLASPANRATRGAVIPVYGKS